jgi:hypothetical protein
LPRTLNDSYLLLARGELPQRYRHASRRVSQRSLSCEIVSNPVCYVSVSERPLQRKCREEHCRSVREETTRIEAI